MALAIVLLINNADTTDLASYTTATFSPTATRWLVVDVNSDATSAPNVPTLSGGGFSYTQEATVLGTTGGGTTRRASRFYTATGGAPGTFAVTFDFAGQTQEMCSWIIYQVDGADVSDPFVHSITATGSSATPTVTLNSFGSADNRPLSFAQAGAAFSAVEGTQIGSTAAAPVSRSWWDSAVADTQPSATLSVAAEWKMLASELKAAGGGAPTVVRRSLLGVGI